MSRVLNVAVLVLSVALLANCSSTETTSGNATTNDLPTQAEPTKVESEPIRDSEKPIDVDFVKKDIHHVFHYISRVSGLDISVEGELDRTLTVFFKGIRPMDAVRSICKSNDLFCVESAGIVTIKDLNDTTSLADVIRPRFLKEDGTVHVDEQGIDIAILLKELAIAGQVGLSWRMGVKRTSLAANVTYTGLTPLEAIRQVCADYSIEIEEGDDLVVVARFQPAPIDVEFIKTKASKVLTHIAEKGGLRVKIDAEVGAGELTVFFKDIDPRDALKSICDSNGYALDELNGQYTVGPAK